MVVLPVCVVPSLPPEAWGWFPVGASIAHTVRALARLYLPSSPFFTSPVGPHLTAPHVVDALETRSQYIDQSISKRMILPPQLSPVSEFQVLCPPCLHEHLPTPCSLLPHLRFAVSAHSPTTPTEHLWFDFLLLPSGPHVCIWPL